MKLNLIQWLWVGAAVLFVGSILLDVANVWNAPAAYMLLGGTLLLLINLRVMPSDKQMKKAQRRPHRPPA